VQHNARHNSKAAIKAIKLVKSEAGAAAKGVKYLKQHASAATAARAAGQVALQYDWDLRTFTHAANSASPSVQSSLIGSLQPVLSGRSLTSASSPACSAAVACPGRRPRARPVC
jgi:hypothetical protein